MIGTRQESLAWRRERQELATHRQGRQGQEQTSSWRKPQRRVPRCVPGWTCRVRPNQQRDRWSGRCGRRCRASFFFPLTQAALNSRSAASVLHACRRCQPLRLAPAPTYQCIDRLLNGRSSRGYRPRKPRWSKSGCRRSVGRALKMRSVHGRRFKYVSRSG